MPGVPWVRPSQGSVQEAANGSPFASRIASPAARTSTPTSQWPVWWPSAIGRPSSPRRPPCVLRIRNGVRVASRGSQPMPAFCVRPKRSPLGDRSSSSGSSGRLPAGPLACERTAPGSPPPRTSESFGSRLVRLTLLRLLRPDGVGGDAEHQEVLVRQERVLRGEAEARAFHLLHEVLARDLHRERRGGRGRARFGGAW